MTKILTPDAQSDRNDFERRYGYDGNCSCHLSAPCGSCTHHGNPLNQEEDDECWMDDPDEQPTGYAPKLMGCAWIKAADAVPQESDGEVFVRFTDGSIGTGWATYWHGASNDFARWTFPDPDEFRLVSEWAKNVPASTGMHWTENEPVRLPHSRAGRVYLAGPMTGISELNFPAFNQEAERLRAEGLQVLNPADHGIVDGADWADYLRHDIAGLASCERIHLLRGWTKSKGACLEMTIAKALGMTVTYQVDAEMEHNNVPAVPQGWPPFDELDDDLIDAACTAGSVLYRVDLMRAYECIRSALLGATPAPAPAVPQGWAFSVSDDDDGTWLRVKSPGGREAAFSAVNGGLAHDNRRSIASRVLLELKEALAATAPAPAQEVATLSLSAEDVHAAFAKNFPKSRISQAWINFAADIAQAIAARAAKPAQDVGLTDEEIDENTVWLDPDPHDNVHCDVSATVRKCLAALRAKGGK